MTDLGAIAGTRHPVMVEKRTGTVEVVRRRKDDKLDHVSGAIRPYSFRLPNGAYHAYLCWRCSTLRNFQGGVLMYYRAYWAEDRLHVDHVQCRCDCVCADASQVVPRAYDAQPGARPWDHWDMTLVRYNALCALQKQELADQKGLPPAIRKRLSDYDVLGNLLAIGELQATTGKPAGHNIRDWLANYWDWRTLPDECGHKEQLLALVH